MAQVDTVKINDFKRPGTGRHLIINADEFDGKKHVLFDGNQPAAKPAPAEDKKQSKA